MKYYIVNLAFHVIITMILFVVTVISSNRNRKRKTAHTLTYFLPVVASITIAVYVFKITGPRLLDLSDVARQNYYSYTGVIEEISVLNNYLVVDGQKYYINPLRDLPEEGAHVKIRYTRYSNYVISVESVDMVDISGTINEEMAATPTSA